MRTISIKRVIIILLVIGIILVASGCARWPDGPGPEPGETEYQLQITVQVYGELNLSDGLYYIVLDNNGNSADGPGEEVDGWNDDYYYVKLDYWGFDFARVVDEGSSSLTLTDSFIGDDEFQVTISLSDLGNPSSIDFNVVTTDSDNNTYYYLDSYLNIGTTLGEMAEDYNSSSDLENDENDFNIIGVVAEIIAF